MSLASSLTLVSTLLDLSYSHAVDTQETSNVAAAQVQYLHVFWWLMYVHGGWQTIVFKPCDAYSPEHTPEAYPIVKHTGLGTFSKKHTNVFKPGVHGRVDC